MTAVTRKELTLWTQATGDPGQSILGFGQILITFVLKKKKKKGFPACQK